MLKHKAAIVTGSTSGIGLGIAREALSNEAAKARLLVEKQASLEFATPEQSGATAVFLCSGAADQIRGTCVSVDGGWTAQ